jgi:hypothetical protein
MHISEDAILQIELAFQKMRQVFQCKSIYKDFFFFIHSSHMIDKATHQYYRVVQFELMRLYELQYELRALSYFSLWRRMQLSITICKVLLQLPIMINTESKERQLLENGNSTKKKGILNQRIESALQLAVGLLETGERYTSVW